MSVPLLLYLMIYIANMIACNHIRISEVKGHTDYRISFVSGCVPRFSDGLNSKPRLISPDIPTMP